MKKIYSKSIGRCYAKSIPEFMEKGFLIETTADKVVQHLKANKSFYINASGFTIMFLLVGFDGHSFAASTEYIDDKAHSIYRRLCTIGKWIIVIRGGIDIISTMTSGDLENMKKKIIGYVLGYIALIGLPWLLDQAGSLFDDQPANAPAQPAPTDPHVTTPLAAPKG